MERPSNGRVKLALFVALFVGLTAAGCWWSLSRNPIRLAELRVVWDLPAPLLVLLGALLPALYVTDVLRYRALGRAVSVEVPWRAAFDASVANFIFSNITPGSTFGVPATLYMLGRRGVPWDAAVVITFAKAFTAAAVVAIVGLVFLFTGLAEFDRRLVAVVAFTGGVFSILFGLLVAAAFRPAAARRVVARCFGWLAARARVLGSAERVTLLSIDRLARLRTGGLVPLVFVAITHLLYFAVFAALGVILIRAFGGAIDPRAFASSWVYVAFVYYLAPTPGGAGFAEGIAIPFFGALLPPEQAIMMVLCYRGLTLYLQVLFGVPYLIIAGTMSAIVARAGRDAP